MQRSGGFGLRTLGVRTNDMTGRDTETDGSTDHAVEQRTLRAFDSGSDDTDDDLAARVEELEERTETLRDLLDTAVDTISELSDMTGHDTETSTDERSTETETYEPAPEPVDGGRGFQ